MLEIERDDIKVKGDGEKLEIKWVTTFIYIYIYICKQKHKNSYMLKRNEISSP